MQAWEYGVSVIRTGTHFSFLVELWRNDSAPGLGLAMDAQIQAGALYMPRTSMNLYAGTLK